MWLTSWGGFYDPTISTARAHLVGWDDPYLGLLRAANTCRRWGQRGKYAILIMIEDPMRPFNWTCPYCGQPSTITQVNFSQSSASIDISEEDYDDFGLVHRAIRCPSPSCGELTLKVFLYRKDWVQRAPTGKRWENKELLNTWQLMPRSRAKPIPEYVPEEIRQNYFEACMIANDSPKASAAMSRRCLQGIVREFWKIPPAKRGNLEPVR